MRSLTSVHEPLLQDLEDEDNGAVLIWVALMMIVLLGVGAIVIDVGALYVEQRQLQNGADAASLAVAQDCAAGDCGGDGGSGIANQYADLNANDGASAIDPTTPCGEGSPLLASCTEPAPSGADGAAGWVRVDTSTETSNGGTEVSFLLAPFISALTGQTVHASAVAAWGPASAATTLPFTFSECEFQELSDGANFPAGTTIIYSKAGNQSGNQPPLFPDCEPRSSPGGTVEGGFGWLNVSGGTCSVELTVGQTITGPGQPGNANLLKKAPCSESLVQNQEVLLPLFNAVSGTGNNVVYTIAGFVGFIVTGYHLSGSTWPAGFSCPPPPGNSGGVGNLRCFQGQFTETVVSGTDFGNSYDFGAHVIGIVG